MSNVIVDREDGVTTLTMNRPERLNSMTHELIDELLDALEAVTEDDDCRVVVLQGAGRAFCAGDDLKSMGEVPMDRWQGRTPVVMPQQRLIATLRSLHKPVVARLHGHVLGMGLDTALACDIRICTDDTQLGDPRADRALYAATGMLYQLPRIVGYGRALEMMLLAERIGGQEAHRRGLVYRSVPEDELDMAVETVVAQLRKSATKSLAMLKMQLREQQDLSFEEAHRHSIWTRATYKIEDGREGIEAFLEKRDFQFTGR